MITKDEYQAAVDVVESYHKQLQEAISVAEKRTGVPVREFILNVDMSARLRTALESLLEWSNGQGICIEYIDEYIFRRLRNCGPLSWNEFSEKREKYLLERQSLSTAQS